YGQLGIGNTSQQTRPTNVLTLSNIVAVSCGYRHSLALSSNGTVWAWGHDASGEVGNGTTTSQILSPYLIPNFSGVASVAAGEDFSVALKTNGSVWVWGESSNGRLGLGSVGPDVTTPTNIAALSNICLITAGSQQAYAIDTSGKLWMWGYNGAWNGNNG